MRPKNLTPILLKDQIKGWDAFTIKNEPIISVELMERASNVFVDWLVSKYPSLDVSFDILCGNGNNGGDGLAVARILSNYGYSISIIAYISDTKRSIDNKINWDRLPKNDSIRIISVDEWMENMIKTQTKKQRILIDALFGTGIEQKIRYPYDKLIKWINLHNHFDLVISIDMPSGCASDFSPDWEFLKADYTFTFQVPKLALLLAESAKYCGKMILGDISLHPDYIDSIEISNYYIHVDAVKSLIRPRKTHSHKGSFGRVVFAAGLHNMPGAALLCAGAALHAGAGYVYIATENTALELLSHLKYPEIICCKSIHEIQSTRTFVMGCGLGTSASSEQYLRQTLTQLTEADSLVLDADALNILATHEDLWEMIPQNVILTPHPKEFDRLFGTHRKTEERLKTMRKICQDKSVYIILKGANTIIGDPSGTVYFNSSGNPGLAKAGSGDVLAGIIAAWLAQGYDPLKASIISVFTHGYTADILLRKYHEVGIRPSWICKYYPRALKIMQNDGL